jgi:hypothetical protein
MQLSRPRGFYTYMHFRGDTGQPCYVGKGRGDRAWSKGGRNPHWHNIEKAHGVRVELLALWSTNAEAVAHEVFLIDCLRSIGLPLVNITAGGEGALGRRLTDEAKARIGAANRGRKKTPEQIARHSEASLGRVFSAEHRSKLATAQRGVKRSPEEIAAYLPALRAAMANPEVRAKIAAAANGRRASPEARARMSASRVGRKASPETRARMSASAKAVIAARKEKQ